MVTNEQSAMTLGLPSYLIETFVISLVCSFWECIVTRKAVSYVNRDTVDSELVWKVWTI